MKRKLNLPIAVLCGLLIPILNIYIYSFGGKRMITKLLILSSTLVGWYIIRNENVSLKVNVIAAMMFVIVFYLLVEEKK